jgi:hypothetical protein
MNPKYLKCINCGLLGCNNMQVVTKIPEEHTASIFTVGVSQNGDMSNSYKVYQEVPAILVWNVPWVNLSRNNQTYLSLKLNSYRDKDKRSFKESELLHIY